jgi:hypothetical protein
MGINTAGYNGLFAISENLVNAALAARVYDPNLVDDRAARLDNDFRMIPIPIKLEDPITHEEVGAR